MKQVEILIENLKCHGCAATIKKGLLKFEEVEQVEVDVENSTVAIIFNGNESRIENYRAKLARLGYPENGQNSGFSVAKSYVSCAIGRMSE